jgi:threonine synthase
MLPMLMTASLRKTGDDRDVCVLAATSGDTGKAALEGFRDVPRTRIMVFYPKDGVSEIQKLQMTTQRGDNVNVVAVKGNFDDAQTGVKSIFSDGAFRERLEGAGMFLSSANSINWGRLVPQIAYYVSAYCDLVSAGRLAKGERINFCVPTGNFGNILAGYYAKKMGLPIGKLICASNRNDVLTQFLRTGVYDRSREFYTTASPSMDILVSSNLERLLYELTGRDGGAVEGYMLSLAREGRYKVIGSALESLSEDFECGSCDDEETMRTISEVFETGGYLIDPHTAVGYSVLCAYRERTGDGSPAVIVSTASPYKFCESVLRALGRDEGECGGAALVGKLAEITGVPAPAPLLSLSGARERFTNSVEQGDMLSAVADFCGVRAGSRYL